MRTTKTAAALATVLLNASITANAQEFQAGEPLNAVNEAAGEVLRIEHAAEAGNDGLVVTEDGTKYVSSVRFGSVSKIVPGRPAEVIATGIPSAASMCYDSVQHQLVIPMNPNNALAFIKL